MNLLTFLLVGLVAGSVAKMITPQKERGGWLSSLGIGVVGSFVGGFAAGLVGIQSNNLIGTLFITLLGSIIVLFIYHRFFSSSKGSQ